MLAYCEGVSIGHISINETAWLKDIHIQHLVDLDKFITAKIAPTCTPKQELAADTCGLYMMITIQGALI